MLSIITTTNTQAVTYSLSLQGSLFFKVTVREEVKKRKVAKRGQIGCVAYKLCFLKEALRLVYKMAFCIVIIPISLWGSFFT